jgi:hypothetical protein
MLQAYGAHRSKMSRWLCCLEYRDSRGFDYAERADDSDELPARPMHWGTLDIYGDWRSVCAAQVDGERIDITVFFCGRIILEPVRHPLGTRIQRMAFRSVQ